MHSDWFNGTEILQGRWQHGEKVGYCCPSGLEKTLFKWDIYVQLIMTGLNNGVPCLQLEHTVVQCRMEHFFAEELINILNSLATADPTTKNIVDQSPSNVHHTFGHWNLSVLK
jgi:hypothetical protein